MITKRNRLLIYAILAALLCVSLCSVSYGASDRTESEDYSLEKIKDTWMYLSDAELNEYIGNNNDTELYLFMTSLSEAEEKQLLTKKTMLNNTISVDNGDGTFDKMPYYKWIKKVGREMEPAVFSRTRGVASHFTAKSGYCFYRFVDNSSGYIVRYKVTFTLNSTANAESTSNNYTVASVIYATSGTNSNKTSLDEVTFAKQKTYMQKANTVYEVLGDGTSSINSSGKKIYRTAITPIFVLTVKVKKPAYTYGTWNTEGFKTGTEEHELAKGSRFNFKEYNWTNDGDTTFDNKVYHAEKLDTLTSCVNILSCGFTVDNVASTELAEGVPENDTINVVYKRPELNIRFHVNGGTVSATESNKAGETPVTRTISYNELYNTSYGLPDASQFGFEKKGYIPKVGEEWIASGAVTSWNDADKTYRATDILDFTDGTYFTSKTRAMFVNWQSKPPERGTLTIRQNVHKSDFYSSHGDSTFVYKISSQKDGKVYYRTISFEESDMKTAQNGVVSKATECVLPYGSYIVEALDVYRYKNVLSSISSGEKVSSVKGSFQMNSSCEEVLAVYTSDKTKWDKFSHNDLVINSLSD